jgi:hypothetical protein
LKVSLENIMFRELDIQNGADFYKITDLPGTDTCKRWQYYPDETLLAAICYKIDPTTG